jgi:hypothetical protein
MHAAVTSGYSYDEIFGWFKTPILRYVAESSLPNDSDLLFAGELTCQFFIDIHIKIN